VTTHHARPPEASEANKISQLVSSSYCDDHDSESGLAQLTENDRPLLPRTSARIDFITHFTPLTRRRQSARSQGPGAPHGHRFQPAHAVSLEPQAVRRSSQQNNLDASRFTIARRRRRVSVAPAHRSDATGFSHAPHYITNSSPPPHFISSPLGEIEPGRHARTLSHQALANTTGRRRQWPSSSVIIVTTSPPCR